MQIDSQQQPEVVPSTSVGINLDAPDTDFPNSPESFGNLEDVAATINYPSVGSMYVQGHGYLPNAILGHSSHPAFRLGAAFEWPEAFNAADLMNYTLNQSYEPRPSPSRVSANPTVAGAPSKSTSPSTRSTVRSYSQAVGSASPAQSSTAQALQGGSSTGAGQEPTGQSSASAAPSSQSAPNPFSNKSLAEARPHPQAYFNPKTLAWTVVTRIPKENETASTSASTGGNCEGPNNTTLRTHHYIRMPRSIDPRFILRPTQLDAYPTYGHANEQTEEPSLGGPSAAPFPDPIDSSHACWSGPPSSPRNCWDLFVCSGCRNAFAVSPADAIPAVLQPSVFQAFVQARLEEEAAKPQKADDASVILAAIEYLWK